LGTRAPSTCHALAANSNRTLALDRSNFKILTSYLEKIVCFFVEIDRR
jgi:hypothetical protein